MAESPWKEELSKREPSGRAIGTFRANDYAKLASREVKKHETATRI